MKKFICKHNLIPDKSNIAKIDVAEGSKVLKVAAQGGNICLWCIEPKSGEKISCSFLILPTSAEFPWLSNWQHLDTVLFGNGALVYHVFYYPADFSA